MRILGIGDNPTTSSNLERLFDRANLNRFTTNIGEEGIYLAIDYQYDLILIDGDCLDMPGLKILRQLRQAKVETPVLMLSNDGTIDTLVKALYSGADDYQTKPIANEELVARIKAIIRRSKGYAQLVIKIGKITIDLDKKTVAVDGQPVHFTNREYQVLELLSQEKGSCISRGLLLNHLYGGVEEPGPRFIDHVIFRLRTKLRVATGGDHYIKTVTRLGYRMEDP